MHLDGVRAQGTRTNLLDYNRYGYARGNPLRYHDPSGHAGVAIHDSNAGPPLLLQNDAFYQIQQDYYNLGVDWNDLPSDVRQSYESYGTTGYVDLAGNAVSQAGTIRNPAVVGASAFAGVRLGSLAVKALGLACADSECTNEASAVQNVVNTSKPLLDSVTKADARSALRAGLSGLSQEQTQRALDILSKGKIDSFSITTLENNQVAMVAQRAGAVDGFQRLIYTVDPSGRFCQMLCVNGTDKNDETSVAMCRQSPPAPSGGASVFVAGAGGKWATAAVRQLSTFPSPPSTVRRLPRHCPKGCWVQSRLEGKTPLKPDSELIANFGPVRDRHGALWAPIFLNIGVSPLNDN